MSIWGYLLCQSFEANGAIQFVRFSLAGLYLAGYFTCFHIYLQENPDLWKWLTGQEQPPEAINMNPVRNPPLSLCFLLGCLVHPSWILSFYNLHLKLGFLCGA